MDILERNRRVLFGKNPWVSAAAALWLASLKKLGLLKALAEAVGTTPASVRNAANRLRYEGLEDKATPAGSACVDG